MRSQRSRIRAGKFMNDNVAVRTIFSSSKFVRKPTCASDTVLKQFFSRKSQSS